MAGITIKEFVTKWGFEVDDKELKKLDAKFAETRSNLQKLEEKMMSVGKSLTAGITLPFVAFAGFSAKAAADAADTQERFSKIFAELGTGADQTAKKFGESFGLSTVAAQDLLAKNGQLLKNFGFSQTQALKYGESIGTLAADIAEFNQVEGGAAEVNGVLKAALAGQTRGLKQYGIVIDDAAIKAQVLSDAQNGQRFATLKQAEAYATLQLIQKKSADSAGAFANSSEDLGVQIQRMKATLANVGVAFGKIFLPPIQKALKVIERGLKWFEGLNEGSKTTIVIVTALAAAIGPLLIALSGMLNIFITIRTAMVLFGNASLVAAAKFLAIPLLIGAAILALGLIIEDIVGFFQGKDSVTGVIVEKFKAAFAEVNAMFMQWGDLAKGVVIAILTPIRALIAGIRGVGGALGALAGGDVSGAFDALKQAGKDVMSPVASLISGQGASIGLGEAAGFGKPEIAASTSSQAGSTTTQSINAPINVVVPPGTSPENVGPYVQKGVGDGLGALLRETQRQNRSSVVN